ncbi:retrovirus-related pol polyprotein from transposon TNT 1-94 [Tanacetum coccineum]
MSTQQDIYADIAERLAKTHDPLALMVHTQTPFHPDYPSHITYMQHSQHNNNYVQQHPFNPNYMQQSMPNPEDISDPTTAIDMALNVGNKNGLSVVLGIANQNGIGNVVAARAEGNANGNNENQMRCYNCQRVDHYARNCIVKPRKRDATTSAYDEIEEMDQLSVEQSGGTLEQHPATVKETHAYFESLYNNLVIEVEKVNTKKLKVFLRLQSLAKKADESLAKHKALEYEIERLLRAVVSQDIMSIVKNLSVIDTSNLQTELDHTKEKLETCIIKKEKEYAVLWNNWYKKCEECKYDKILYDKPYKDMQQKIERLQA